MEKIMQKNGKLIISSLLLMFILFIGGCLESISIDLPNSPVDINKWDVYTQYFNFTSTYSGAQKVTITLSTNDPRIGVSWDSKTFQPSIVKELEVGKNFSNQEIFYIKVIDQNIPKGEYEIVDQITVQKNNVSSSNKMTIRIGFK